MPYIDPKRRNQVELYGYDGGGPNVAESTGELNYQFTQLINAYLANKIKDYAAYNAVIGALECCKLEVYRRLVAPYEDKKINENSDVF